MDFKNLKKKIRQSKVLDFCQMLAISQKDRTLRMKSIGLPMDLEICGKSIG
jgi:hypothetical protein